MLYSGEQFDTGLQQYYLRARYYNQNNGRFNQLDPFAGDNFDPQSLHKYAYVHADPVNRADPSGKWGIALIIVLVVVAIVLSADTAEAPRLNGPKVPPSNGAIATVTNLFTAVVGGAILGKVFGAVGRYFGMLFGLSRGAIVAGENLIVAASENPGTIVKIAFNKGTGELAAAGSHDAAKALLPGLTDETFLTANATYQGGAWNLSNISEGVAPFFSETEATASQEIVSSVVSTLSKVK